MRTLFCRRCKRTIDYYGTMRAPKHNEAVLYAGEKCTAYLVAPATETIPANYYPTKKLENAQAVLKKTAEDDNTKDDKKQDKSQDEKKENKSKEDKEKDELAKAKAAAAKAKAEDTARRKARYEKKAAEKAKKEAKQQINSIAWVFEKGEWKYKGDGAGGKDAHAERQAWEHVKTAKKDLWVGFTQNSPPCATGCLGIFLGYSADRKIIFNVTGDHGGYCSGYTKLNGGVTPQPPFRMYFERSQWTFAKPKDAPDDDPPLVRKK